MSKPFKIVTDVPVPIQPVGGRRPGPITDAIRTLAAAPINASMFLPMSASRAQNYIRYAAGPGWATARAEGKGCRVWKIAEPKEKGE